VAVIISTTRFEQVGSPLANQIDSVEACSAETGTSEINGSSSRVNPAAPKCLYQFREYGGLISCPRFDEFRGQNPI